MPTLMSLPPSAACTSELRAHALPSVACVQGVSPYQWQRGPQASTFASGYMRPAHQAKTGVRAAADQLASLHAAQQALEPCLPLAAQRSSSAHSKRTCGPGIPGLRSAAGQGWAPEEG